jgi:hypothetical protein
VIARFIRWLHRNHNLSLPMHGVVICLDHPWRRWTWKA